MKGPTSKQPAGLFWYKTSEIYNNFSLLYCLAIEPVDQVTDDTVVQDYLEVHAQDKGPRRHHLLPATTRHGWVCLMEGTVLGMIQLFNVHPTLGLSRSLHSMGQHYFGIGRVKNIQNSDPLLF